MLDCFRSTDFKFKVASLIYKVLTTLGFRDKRVISRNGVSFEVDLSEGIDLSLFLFGSFQKNVTRSHLFRIPDDAVMIDVGANIGSICLPLIQACPHGHLYAFEPTNFAFEKLLRNISLNSALENRIEAIQSRVSSKSETVEATKIFSSWKLSQDENGSHPVHHGTAMEATGESISIDDFVRERGLERLDFIKVDTDGYELDVFNGALSTLGKMKPVVVFELTRYLLEEKGISFSQIEEVFLPWGYRLVDTKSGVEINQSNFLRLVPQAGSTDVAAIPQATPE